MNREYYQAFVESESIRTNWRFAYGRKDYLIDLKDGKYVACFDDDMDAKDILPLGGCMSDEGRISNASMMKRKRVNEFWFKSWTKDNRY